MKTLTHNFVVLLFFGFIPRSYLISSVNPYTSWICGDNQYWDANTNSCHWLYPITAPPHVDAEEICTFTHSKPKCEYSRYRTIDGTCNNIENPLWGAINSLSDRLLPALYGDGFSSFQTSVTGNELKSARTISKAIFGEDNVPDKRYTIANMQFGQFMAHDMSKGLANPVKIETTCCSGHVGQYQSSPYPCFAIDIPDPDPAYPSDLKCMEFIRSSHTGEVGCPPTKPIEQINQVTSFLDLSLIYGLNNEQANSLRTFEGGRLITVERGGYEWPPQDPNPTQACFVNSNDDICYRGGDTRLNQSPHLTIIHVLYIREHNRIAKHLSKLNPKWEDERLYQEARRINIAQYQYVSYYEWLTIFMGKDNLVNEKILYYYEGGEYVNDYNPSVKPTVYNEHANAAFRYFHSQIEGKLNLLTESRDIADSVQLSDVFNIPAITENKFDYFTRGMVHQPAQTTDFNYDQQIREYFLKDGNKFGMDLKALDIQRARDHGVARYNHFRKYCGFHPIRSWEEFAKIFYIREFDILTQMYESVDDVEFAVGSMLETHVDETLVGPTLLCVLNKQFYVTRVGDRYWFESGDPEVAFTPEQLAEIRKSSFARLVCDNANNVQTIQPEAFKVPGYNDGNPIVDCGKIQFVNLDLWKE